MKGYAVTREQREAYDMMPEITGMESNETLDFIEDKTPTNTTNQLRMDIVKDIIENKLATIAASQQRAENKIQREKIMEILEQKSDSAMLKKTPAELRKMLDKLGA